MTNQGVLSDDMRPNTDQVAREYLEARALLRERGREDREIREDQKRREGLLMAFLEDTDMPIRLDGFDGPETHNYSREMLVMLYMPTRTATAASPAPEGTP